MTLPYEPQQNQSKRTSWVRKIIYGVVLCAYAVILFYLVTQIAALLQSPLGQAAIENLKSPRLRQIMLNELAPYKWWILAFSVVFWILFAYAAVKLIKAFRGLLDWTYNKINRS